MNEYYICVDLGTSKIKCSLISGDGNFIYYSKRDAKTYYDEIVYQNPDDYFNIILEEIGNVKNAYPREFNKILSFIISGQMGGVLGIDKDFNVVFPWTYSIDTKYNNYLFKLEKDFKKQIRESSGGIPTIAAKILWIKEKFPDKYLKIKKFINLMSYVSCKLCNISYKHAFIDCSCLTMSGIADIKNGVWNKQLCREFDIDTDKLPVIKKANEKIGIIDNRILGTYREIIMLTGCGDQVAGFIGAGINTENDLIDVSGTYTILGYCSNRYVADTEFDSLHSIYSGISNIYYQISIITAGGYTFDWFLKNFNYTRGTKLSYIKDISKKEKLFFLPHFGGRYSPSQPYFRGGWFGVTWDHNINDFYISILESSGYEFFYALDIIKKINNLKNENFNYIKVIGEGSLNDCENEIKCNILNLKYVRQSNMPYELLGSFLIAKFSENINRGYKLLLDNKIIRVEKVFLPSKSLSEYYKKIRGKYFQLIDKIGETYYEINSLE